MSNPGKYGGLILEVPEIRRNIARYLWSVFAEATQFRNSDFPDETFIIDTTGQFAITDSFDDILDNRIKSVAKKYNLPEGLEMFRREEPLACAFYLMNGLHESLLDPEKLDRYDRYPYTESIQHANHITEVNYVQQIFDEIFTNITGKPAEPVASTLMWSHDIDYLYSAWKSDLIMAMRERRFAGKFKFVQRALSSPFRWNNINDLLELEERYGIQSVFFWISERGKTKISADNHIDHADYGIRSKQVRHYWDLIRQAGSVNGLHKSAFTTSLAQEAMKMPDPVIINRNHFLRIRLPDHYYEVEKAGLKYDATLGFAEHPGFRNSFGRPFRPYNIRKNKPFSFIEYPLHLMDTTFRTYLGQDLEATVQSMIDFVHRHRNDCTISILLHNTSFHFADKAHMKIWYRLFDALRHFEPLNPHEL